MIYTDKSLLAKQTTAMFSAGFC